METVCIKRTLIINKVESHTLVKTTNLHIKKKCTHWSHWGSLRQTNEMGKTPPLTQYQNPRITVQSRLLRPLAKHHVTVEDRFALLLDLPLPALLSVLHFVEHVGARARTGKHVMGVGEGLLVPNIIVTLNEL